MSEIKLTNDNFDSEVLHSDMPVLVDFWASWCGPCKMLMPLVDAIAQEYDGKIKVGKVNIDEEMRLAENFNITTIPTLILFKDGAPTKKSVGLVSKEQIRKLLV